ncbi:hypothetical protein SAMN02910384_03197 [Pseudobutyrivibrio sp. ACV-2]|uniref:hypothetical protein n=1 Tax=Pseudobutyrivibrio sp. ACV-2 TaxID=1520801 RepID=UPI000897DAC7|nr:hypothetical protein [Pseudobutyrivibrio sp. ACV-2]SEB04513.1 hypothetical protein SAMN02910384_03197 [Pseudobutyrivibrio sp. ACV-2]
MAMSLKDKLASQLNTNNEEMQKAKESAKAPASKPEEKKVEAQKKETVKQEKKTVTESKPVQKTVKAEKTAAAPEPKTKAEVTPKPKAISTSSKMSFETWTTQTIEKIDAISSDDERIYRPITVDIDNWKYIDEVARSLSTAARKITHNEYIELLIKKEVDEFNSLSEKEKDIVQATVDLKHRTNKTKTVGLRFNYWNAFDQLCIIHGHCPKCDMINLLIEKDIEENHPKKAAITKISL